VRLFYNALDCSDDKIKFEILRLPVLEYLIECLKIKDLENQIYSLGGLKYMLDYGKEINIYYNEKLNIVQRQVEDLNGIFYISKCAESNNKEVSELANEILQEFFSREESNKLNN
jgi:hypothetical protein